MPRLLTLVLTPVLVTLAVACGGSDPCGAAAAHVAECTGSQPAAAAACDADRAGEILALDCGALAATAPGKADGLGVGSALCALGFSSYCEQPPQANGPYVVRGAVRYPDGRPAPWRAVRLSSPSLGDSATQYTGQDGMYVFVEIPEGAFTLQVLKRGGENAVSGAWRILVEPLLARPGDDGTLYVDISPVSIDD